MLGVPAIERERERERASERERERERERVGEAPLDLRPGTFPGGFPYLPPGVRNGVQNLGFLVPGLGFEDLGEFYICPQVWGAPGVGDSGFRV